jgi:hypoxanthine phosphoribosyltransferase
MNKINQNKIYIDYCQFGKKLVSLYKKIKRGGVPSVIIGIANGGLNISKPISNWFQCKHITASIHFYDGDKKTNEPFYVNIPNIPTEIKNILIIDDILDTGSTIRYFENHTGLKQHKNFKIASLHWNPNGESGIKPDYYVNKKPKNSWIVYPWETEYVEML